MENKKMSCWDFVFSSVKTHIDDLVRLTCVLNFIFLLLYCFCLGWVER